MQVNIHETKTHLSQLLNQVTAGEEVIIAKAGEPMWKIIPWHETPKPRRPLGIFKGKIRMTEDFDELPKEILAAFNGED